MCVILAHWPLGAARAAAPLCCRIIAHTAPSLWNKFSCPFWSSRPQPRAHCFREIFLDSPPVMDWMFVSLPPQIRMLKHWATMWWLGLWEVIGLDEGGGPHNGISVFIKKRERPEFSLSLLHGKMQWQGSHLQPGKESSPGTWIGWYFDCGLVSLQSCEKQVSVG